MGQITPINKIFNATMEDRDSLACVVWLESVTFFGSSKSVKAMQPGDVIEVSLDERL